VAGNSLSRGAHLASRPIRAREQTPLLEATAAGDTSSHKRTKSVRWSTTQKQALEEAQKRADRAKQELERLKGQQTLDDDVPATKNTAEPSGQGESELRKDSMMSHLLDALQQGKDIGHYGRLVFAMVARHFLTPDELVAWLTRDPDFSEAQARTMLAQVEQRDYNPPRRERLLEWQAQQEFPILPHPEDPDCGNLYRNLKFPDSIYNHIEQYQEQKLSPD
jgi:hypothetical protein